MFVQIPEVDERYMVELSPPFGGASSGYPRRATVYIKENDNPIEFTSKSSLISLLQPFSQGVHQSVQQPHRVTSIAPVWALLPWHLQLLSLLVEGGEM